MTLRLQAMMLRGTNSLLKFCGIKYRRNAWNTMRSSLVTSIAWMIWLICTTFKKFQFSEDFVMLWEYRFEVVMKDHKLFRKYKFIKKYSKSFFDSESNKNFQSFLHKITYVFFIFTSLLKVFF